VDGVVFGVEMGGRGGCCEGLGGSGHVVGDLYFESLEEAEHLVTSL
jgi:hypothetical protein